jgi:cytochrome c2
VTLDQIIAKAKTYVLADNSGEHNLGEVMDGLRVALSDACDALEHANDLLGPNTNQIIGREAALVRGRAALKEAGRG